MTCFGGSRVEERYAGYFSSLQVKLVSCIDLLGKGIVIERITGKEGICPCSVSDNHPVGHRLEVRHIFSFTGNRETICGEIGNYGAFQRPTHKDITIVGLSSNGASLILRIVAFSAQCSSPCWIGGKRDGFSP